MAALEDRFRDDLEKVRKWRSALFEAASLSSAWLFENVTHVSYAFVMLPPKRFHSTDYTVGLEPHIEKVMSLVNKYDDSVCMLGIYGTGGKGKKTLAKAVYNSIFYQFEGSCFLFDIREESNKYKGIVLLQQSLLSEILEEKKMTFSSIDDGISRIKHRLSHKKVLLVLDDDDIEQLEQLAGRILEACDYGARFYIEVLAEKSLITISDNGRLDMHDLIQQMGKQIVRKETKSDLGKRSRLWYYKDVLKVLPENLKFEHVTHMDFSHCEFITEVPDMSQFQSLRRFLFQGCRNLLKVHDSAGRDLSPGWFD
ncbi:TMV resistance protein N-like [Neltuma alba]|uniref:TMV resistance protein N-like n=1 Tax=Neltuma alba TaxID=207710 RepID=UPI0010A51FAC|nr:TMV resistance protein N-like [Prosopis alba]